MILVSGNHHKKSMSMSLEYSEKIPILNYQNQTHDKENAISTSANNHCLYRFC
jgi:hypothetical protein